MKPTFYVPNYNFLKLFTWMKIWFEVHEKDSLLRRVWWLTASLKPQLVGITRNFVSVSNLDGVFFQQTLKIKINTCMNLSFNQYFSFVYLLLIISILSLLAAAPPPFWLSWLPRGRPPSTGWSPSAHAGRSFGWRSCWSERSCCSAEVPRLPLVWLAQPGPQPPWWTCRPARPCASPPHLPPGIKSWQKGYLAFLSVWYNLILLLNEIRHQHG